MLARCALVLAAVAASAAACSTDADCEHLGVCTAGACACDAGWVGQTCGTLDLVPSPPDSGLRQANSSNWCGTILRDEANASLFHSYNADFGGCANGLNIWLSGSRVIHATASSAVGPYTPVWADGGAEVAVAAEAHNPQAVRAPDGSYLLFDSYGGPDAGCPLTANYTTCGGSGTCAPKMPSGGGVGWWVYHRASSPAGPWAPVNVTVDFPCFSKNLTPSPFFHPNGTFFLVFHCDADATHAMGDLVMVRAATPAGPFARVNDRVWAVNGVGPHAEDPFAWTRRHPVTGAVSWHIILHNTPRGIHLVSTDGLTFALQQKLGPTREPLGPFVFNETVANTDGTTFTAGRRERPWLLFAAGTRSRPEVLVTSMQASGAWPRVFTHAQGVK